MNTKHSFDDLDRAWRAVHQSLDIYAGYLIRLQLDQVFPDGRFNEFTISEYEESADFAGIKQQLEQKDSDDAEYVLRIKANDCLYDEDGNVRTELAVEQETSDGSDENETDESDESDGFSKGLLYGLLGAPVVVVIVGLCGLVWGFAGIITSVLSLLFIILAITG